MVRFKRRYLLVEISFKDGRVDDKIATRLIYDTVKNAVKDSHGDYGMACVARSLQVKYVNPVTGMAFIACSRDYYRMVWSALTFIRTITFKKTAIPCMFRVLHVGGTLVSCQKFLIRHNKSQLLQLLQQCKTPAERQKISKTIKKAEEYEVPLDPKKRKIFSSTAVKILPDEEDFDSN
ncbi:RNA-binding protein pop5 [Desmophyllum pertusum]|uniref:Ribonuclease P/MRP protein subunit POP5 n=1 Tax=Desmophyllum pertusum TaxID=174260 RepID=A0A9X0D635_9CNID|nr:RNA-binding protein pop5 [Desmophyllum pertusum]